MYQIDARTFQKPLGELAEVLAQKVKREAPKLLNLPPHVAEFVAGTMFLQVRQAMRTYDLLFYLNADERRANDCYWKPAYTIVTLPLVRSMIDHLYNVTAILENPAINGPAFCKSGFRRLLDGIDEDERCYGGRPDWDADIAERRRVSQLLLQNFRFSLEEVRGQRPWLTLGAYLRSRDNTPLTEHQEFLKLFTYGMWRDYSAKSHGAFEGGFDVGIYFVPDALQHEERDKLDEPFPKIVSLHLTRAAAILLCIVTELQARFHFEGARINERILEIWKTLIPVFGVKELYDGHYAQLMRESGIDAPA